MNVVTFYITYASYLPNLGMAFQPDQALPYLDWIDTVVERPHGVEVVLHALLEVLRHRVQDGEVLQLGTHV